MFMLKNVAIVFCLIFCVSSCGSIRINHILTRGYYQIESVFLDSLISKDEVLVIGKVFDARTKYYCSNVVVKNLVDDKKMVSSDSLGNFKLFLKSEKIKLFFSHSGNSNLVTDTICLNGGSNLELSIFLGSDVIFD